MSLLHAVLPGWLRPEPTGKMIRMGRDNDGGYVLPEAAIASADALLSLGLNDDWSFDRAFNRLRPSAPIIGYDPTISAGKFWCKALSRTLVLPLAILIKPRRSLARCLHSWRVAFDYGPFFGGRAKHVRLWISGQSGEGKISLADALATSALADARRLVLKIDIEGAEYPVFASLPPSSLDRTSVLLVEFHDVSRHLAEIESLARSLGPKFAIAHVHANNFAPVTNGVPEVLEVVRVLRGFCLTDSAQSAPSLPLPGLDQPNQSELPDIALRFQP